MATEKILNTRIQLRYDVWNEWSKIKDTFVPKKGEVCVVEIPNTNTTSAVSAVNYIPTVLFRVGDGKTTFGQLPWVSATAADVYSWAKKSEAEFTAWAKSLVPVEVTESGTGKFITDVTATNDENGHHITITRADVDWTDITNKPNLVNSIVTTDDNVIELIPTTASSGDVTIDGKHAKKGPANGYTGTQAEATVDAFGESMTIKVPKLTVDEYGHTNTAEEVEYKITLPTPEAATNTVTTLTEGKGIKIEDTANDGNHNYTVSHQDKPTSGTAQTATAGTGRTYITEVLVDNFGHIASVKTATETVVDTNTAHTHTDGVGTKIIGNNGGIDGDVKIDLDIKFNDTLVEKDGKKYLQILDKTNTSTIITEFDVTEFVKDGMLESVTTDTENNTLTFTWNTDGDKTETTVKLSEIADIYTGAEGITVGTDGKIIITDGGVTTNKIADEAIDVQHLSENLLEAAEGDIGFTRYATDNNGETLQRIRTVIKPKTVGTTELDDAAVTATQIADKAVTKAKLADEVLGDLGEKTVKTYVDDAIANLDVTDTAETNKYVSAVSETDGKISVSRETLPVYSVTAEDKPQSVTIANAEGSKVVTGKALKVNGTELVEIITAENVSEIAAESIKTLDYNTKTSNHIEATADYGALVDFTVEDGLITTVERNPKLTGYIEDLDQRESAVLVLYGGSATENI